jgi:hypothetical protein
MSIREVPYVNERSTVCQLVKYFMSIREVPYVNLEKYCMSIGKACYVD